MAENLYGYGLNFENPYGRNTTGHTASVYRLAQMGLDMASIPAMSSDCERVFSQGKLLITGQRNRLKADIIEATQCLRMWLILDRKALGKWTGRGNWVTPFELHNISE
jgi:hypothetical protein